MVELAEVVLVGVAAVAEFPLPAALVELPPPPQPATMTPTATTAITAIRGTSRFMGAPVTGGGSEQLVVRRLGLPGRAIRPCVLLLPLPVARLREQRQQ